MLTKLRAVARRVLDSRLGRRLRAAFRKTVLFSAYAYPVALLVTVLLFRYVGEGAWLISLALFAPRLVFALPVLFLAVTLYSMGRRRLLWTQLVAALIVLFPLMGLELPKPFRADAEGRPSLRVMSMNVDRGYRGYTEIVEEVKRISPDVLLVQESKSWADFGDLLKQHYPHVLVSGQFAVASRFPLLDTTEPDRIQFWGRERSPRFTRYLIDTRLGPIAFYNVHPISPRGALGFFRLRDTLHALRKGALLSDDAAAEVASYIGLRSLQVQTAARLARAEPRPALLVGDFNVPGLSPVLHEDLADFQDGFAEVGSGFGYTFPARYPFLRLDRVFAKGPFRFTSFEVGCKGRSDHLCVVAELVRDDGAH